MSSSSRITLSNLNKLERYAKSISKERELARWYETQLCSASPRHYEGKQHMKHSMKIGAWFLTLCLAVSITACGEEADPNLPSVLVQNSSAECRDDNGVTKLDYIEVAVLDFDGADNMGPAEVRVLANLLTMEQESAPYEPGVDEAGNPTGPVCEVEGSLCVTRYVWRRSSDAEQIFCDGEMPLTIEFKAADLDGHEVNVILLAEPVAD